jgi:hypothetical protein
MSRRIAVLGGRRVDYETVQYRSVHAVGLPESKGLLSNVWIETLDEEH